MALLLQTTLINETKGKELILIYKLSGDADAQQFVLRGSNFTEEVDNQVHISRYVLHITDGWQNLHI